MAKQWLDIYDVDVHFNAPGGSRATRLTQRSWGSFRLLELSGFFMFSSSIFAGVISALLLASFLSTITWLPDLLLAPTASPLNRYQRARVLKLASLSQLHRQNGVAPEKLSTFSNCSLCSTICWQFHLWLRTGLCLVSSTKHSVGRNKSNGGEAIARLSPNASSCPCIVERNDQDLVVFAGRFVDPKKKKKKKKKNQWSPVGILTRHWGEIQREPYHQQTTATSEEKTLTDELECSCSSFPMTVPRL